MPDITLAQAQAIVTAALAEGRRLGLKPLVVTVLDGRGTPKALAAEDGTSLSRAAIAHGKAHGALALGMGGRAIMARSEQQPAFIAAVTHAAGGALIPVPGGVLLRQDGALLGAVGISGDTSDNDEKAALAGIAAAGLQAEP